MVFALFNVVWATLFLERWKRREAELAYKWGTLDPPAESLEEPRPQFRVGGAKFWFFVFFFLSFSQVVSHLTSVSIGSEALQPHYWTGRVLLPSVAAAPVQVVGQPARVYPVYLLCLPGHAHLLRAAGQSLFFFTKPNVFVLDLVQPPVFYCCRGDNVTAASSNYSR